MLYATAIVSVLALLGILVDDDHSPIRASHARLARLYRAQERWAAEMDRRADRHAPAGRRHIA